MKSVKMFEHDDNDNSVLSLVEELKKYDHPALVFYHGGINDRDFQTLSDLLYDETRRIIPILVLVGIKPSNTVEALNLSEPNSREFCMLNNIDPDAIIAIQIKMETEISTFEN